MSALDSLRVRALLAEAAQARRAGDLAAAEGVRA
jgi:hypothetical protein